MQKNNPTHSGFLIPRIALALVLFASAAYLAFFSFAANPPSGTLMEGGSSVSYTAGPFLISNPTGNAPTGVMCTAQFPCDEFTLNVNVATAEFVATKNVKVSVSWPNAAEDYDVYVRQGATEVTSAASSANPEIAVYPAVLGNNTYTIRTVPFAVAGGSITALIEFVDKPVAPPPGNAGIAPRFHVFAPPAGLGASAGEPSIGVGKAGMGGQTEGRAMFIASLDTLRISFNDCSSPASDPGFPGMPTKTSPLWEDVSFLTTSITTLDPILFTDRQTGRTFVSQLGPKTSFLAYTDNDGGTGAAGDYIQSQGSGINSGVDHQTVGGGPFAPPLTRNPNGPIYPNAVYYASQDAAIAQAAVSLDGGQTFGPAVPMYNLTQCGGIHGHLKVAPDGTAYVPNKSCGGKQAVVVSENNGASWEVRLVPQSVAASGIIDPGVSVGADNTVYFGGVGPDGIPFTAVSRDRGRTWINFQPIGVELGIQNATFSQMTAGDGDRAAFSFLGTTTPGNYQAPRTTPGGQGFKGTWFLYISTTYDRGITWTTVNATPNDPVQQGSICNSGTVTCNRQPNDRNLLDFNDIQIDQEGRILAAFADGCISQACIQGLDANNDGFKDNDFAARATIARQAGGRRLLAAFDPVSEEPNAPAAPRVDSVVKDSGGIVRIAWSAPDNGGSAITGYNVYRSDTGAAGPYVRLGGASPPTSSADKTTYDDTTATSTIQYFYRVTAVNVEGEGSNCGEFPVGAAVSLESPCILPGVTLQVDPAGDELGEPANAQRDIREISIAELFNPASTVNRATFRLKVANLTPTPAPTTRWTIFFTRADPAPATTSTEWFVAMVTDDTLNPGTPVYRYGHTGLNQAGVRQLTTDGTADSGSNTPDGTILITIGQPTRTNTGATGRTFPPLRTGESFSVVNAITQQSGGVLLLTTDSTGNAQYTLAGNASCAPNLAPLALLTATPTSGQAPLNVTFDASGSSDMDAADSIVSYQFNFGEGTPPPPQSSPMISHTYNDTGTYRATVRVTDSRGKVSENVADVLIDVGSLLQNVVSRKIHGTIEPPFDIELPNQGQPGIESRSGGANGTHQMIFTFVDPVTAVGSTNVSGPKGSPSGSGTLGPNANQYTVNLTGVENAQYITVTLNGVQTGGTTLNNIQGTMGLLEGDVNFTKVVTGADVNLCKVQQSQPVTESNFRTDINANGVITGADVNLIRAKQSSSLP